MNDQKARRRAGDGTGCILRRETRECIIPPAALAVRRSSAPVQSGSRDDSSHHAPDGGNNPCCRPNRPLAARPE